MAKIPLPFGNAETISVNTGVVTCEEVSDFLYGVIGRLEPNVTYTIKLELREREREIK